MSNENIGSANDSGENSDKPVDDSDAPQEGAEDAGRDYAAEIRELRKEAAKYRTERNELREDAKKWRDHEEASKSELDKAAEKVRDLEAKNEAITCQMNRLDVANRFGIGSDDVEFLGSGSVEDMEARASRLVKLMQGANKPGPPGRAPVERLGTPSGESAKSPAAPTDYPSWWRPRSR